MSAPFNPDAIPGDDPTTQNIAPAASSSGAGPFPEIRLFNPDAIPGDDPVGPVAQPSGIGTHPFVLAVPVPYTPIRLTAALTISQAGVTYGPYPAGVSVGPSGGQFLTLSLPFAPAGLVSGPAVLQPGNLVAGVFTEASAQINGNIEVDDSAVILSAEDLEAVRALAGISGDEWPDALVSSGPYLGAAVLEATRRIPCDWLLLDPASLQCLRLGLIYQTASLVVPSANPGRTENVKIGSFSLQTDDTGLLGDAGTLMGWANQYYASVVLPAGVVALAAVDAYARPVIRKAHIGRRRPFGLVR